MRTEERDPTVLIPARPSALSAAGVKSLAERGRNHLRNKEEAEEWLRKGLQLQESAPEALSPEVQTKLEYIKQILAGTQPDVAAKNLGMTPGDQEMAHVWHFFMPDTLKGLQDIRESQLLEAFRCFERGIHLDPHHPLLQHSIGTAYFFGRGVKQDYSQAYVWFLRAAEQGKADAEYCLGVLYDNGNGVTQDNAQAAAWLRKAAEKGNALAQWALGLAYETGEGVPKDEAQAAFWIQRSGWESHRHR
jgi:TPR repeat protein